ncbi:MAG: type II secretion system protein [Candidatus Gracilibacteria bacterium]|nr:type II secretion system protein [Candidatus Gracilibacteria bacterium]
MKKTKTLSNNNLAFTLVELIVVIVILAILTTVAFIYIGSYVKYSRDSKRISDIRSIANVIDIKFAKGIKPGVFLSNPTTNQTFSGDTLIKEGIIDDATIIKLKDLSKTPIDPVSNDYYKYSTTSKGSFYQIFSNLERGNGINSTIVPKTYAAWEGAKIFKVIGNYNGLFLISDNGKYYSAPSLFIDDRGIDSEGYAWFYIDGKTEVVRYRVIEVASNTPVTDDEVYDFAIKMYNSYVGSGINESIFSALDINDREKVITFGKLLLAQKISASRASTTSTVNGGCILDGQTVASGSTVTAYQESEVSWFSLYDCDSIALERTCENGVLSGDSSYQYLTCFKGFYSSCDAVSSYDYNSHIYNIPELTHTESATGITSTPITVDNGTYTYTLDSISCNDGTLINQVESGPTLISCNSGYTASGSTCVIGGDITLTGVDTVICSGCSE